MSLAKLIAHYEIYKMIKNLPGNIIELGVFKGESLLRFAYLTEIFEPYDRSFKLVGFDTFTGFTKINKNPNSDSYFLDRNSYYSL